MFTFGTRLKSARRAAGLTQQQLGDAVGVSKGAISRWESDIDRPQFEYLAALRGQLRVSLDELILDDLTKIKAARWVLRTMGRVAEASPSYGLANDDSMRVQSSAEYGLLQRFRTLPDKKKDALLELLKPER